MTTRKPRTARPRPPRLELAALLLIAGHGCCAAQNAARWVNSYPAEQGFGAANAGAAGLLPAGPAAPAAKDPARQNGALNSYDAQFGYGAANAGATGKLPQAPSAISNAMTSLKHRGQGANAAAGGAATGAEAGASSGNVGTSGSDGAGSR